VQSGELLSKPLLPAAQGGRKQDSSRGNSSSSKPRAASQGGASGGSGSSSSSGSSGYSYVPLHSSSIVQQHRVAADSVRLVLGHSTRLADADGAAAPRVPAAAAAAAAAASPTSLALPPPSRFGVANLHGFQQLGLAGQPAMVLGWDVWARQRAVVCLRAGLLYLTPP
jgi:hypothetical protein